MSFGSRICIRTPAHHLIQLSTRLGQMAEMPATSARNLPEISFLGGVCLTSRWPHDLPKLGEYSGAQAQWTVARISNLV